MKNISFNKYLTQKSFNKTIINNDLTELKQEIIKTLEELALNGFLNTIVFSDDHITNFSSSWNKFVNQEISSKNDDDNLMYNINFFVDKLIHFNIPSKKNITEESLKESFNKFIDFLNIGNFETYCTPEGECFNCGAKLNLIFKNWEPTFFEFKEIMEKENYKKKVSENSPLNFLNKMDYFPAEKCFKDFLKIKDFEFKTGNLIITDWIRLDEFTKTVEVDSNIYNFNINNAKGRNDSFEHYFNQNFISINTYSGLDIYSLKNEEKNNCLFFGKIDYEKNDLGELNKKNYKFEKTVNRGLRATTIIEEEILINIINQKLNDLDKTKKIVNDYLKSNKTEIIKKKITPGIYSLIFDLRFKDVSDLLFPENITEEFNSKIFLYPKNLFPNFKNSNKKFKI